MSIVNQENIKLKNIGSKDEVYHGSANKTSGGLHKEDLIMNVKGKIVSKKKSEQAKLRKINKKDLVN